MPRVLPTHILSFSSEDPNHPASNLLCGDTYRKWKCKSVGEPECSVVFQLERTYNITAVAIGNEGSAFVEVHVARSLGDADTKMKYQVLLSSAAFMSPSECRNWESTNRMKLFNVGAGLLNKTVSEERWDVIKVICTQQFNKHVQYGLSFVNFHTNETTEERERLGLFGILDEPGWEDIQVGSFFARKAAAAEAKKKYIDVPKNPAARIRAASAALLAGGGVIKSSTPLFLKGVPRTPPQKSTSKVEDVYDDDENPRPSTSTNIPKVKPKKAGPIDNANSKTPDASKNDQDKSDPAGTSTPGPAPKPKKKINVNYKLPQASRTSAKQPSKQPTKQQSQQVKKPFNKLLEGVVFSISGYENPHRSLMRNKAIEMGAVYKHDWDPSCTHLLCAFVNTPKYRQARRGPAKICKLKWIQECYSRRRRVPWRKYWVDRNDDKSASEDEILALTDVDDVSSFESDENDEDGDNSPWTKTTPRSKQKSPTGAADSEKDDGILKKRPRRSAEDESTSDDENEGYDYDTEVDTPDEPTPESRKANSQNGNHKGQKAEKSNESLAFFRDVNFYLDPKMPESLKMNVRQSITVHKGIVKDTLDQSVQFYMTHSERFKQRFKEAIRNQPSISIVMNSWIKECKLRNRMVIPNEFVLENQEEDGREN